MRIDSPVVGYKQKIMLVQVSGKFHPLIADFSCCLNADITSFGDYPHFALLKLYIPSSR